MTTVVWHRGKARTFKDDEQATPWIKEVEMAKQEKRAAKPSAVTSLNTEATPVPVEAPTELAVPETCVDCKVTFDASNVGGVLVSHPTPRGSVTGVAHNQDEATAWLETTHAQECQ